MKKLHTVTFLLLVVGGINWLLEVFGWGIGGWGFVPANVVTVLYILIGLSAVYELFNHKHSCKSCSAGGAEQVGNV